jgi:glycosyltransferase involved in cell wall biosynthesis
LKEAEKQLNESFFTNLQIMVSSHRYIYGPGEALIEFLIDKRIKNLLVCLHSIPQVDATWNLRDLSSILEYENGNLVYTRTLRIVGTPFIDYIIHFILSCFLPLIRRRRFHVAIGEGLPDTLACIVLKKIGFVKTVVFHAHSFQPSMFRGVRRTFYILLTKLCLRNSDWIWNLSDRLARLHESLGAQDRKNIIVPIGIDTKFLKVRDSRKPKGKLVFVGHLKDDQGIMLAVRAMSKLQKSYPNLKLLVIGGGPLFKPLERFINHANLKENVSMLGPLPYPKVMEILTQCDIGVAMYKPSSTSIAKVTDPMKLKMYLASGLPVITTNLPWLSPEIKFHKAGLVINYNEGEFAEAVIEILHNYEVYHAGAVKLASTHGFWSWDVIFKNAMETVVRKT